jgi:hypothetical protein
MGGGVDSLEHSLGPMLALGLPGGREGRVPRSSLQVQLEVVILVVCNSTSPTLVHVDQTLILLYSLHDLATLCMLRIAYDDGTPFHYVLSI